MATLEKTPRSTTITLADVSSGPFILPFRVFDTDAIRVYLNGVEIDTFTLNVTFIDGYSDAATIILHSAAASGDVIVIDSDLYPYRGDDYLRGDPAVIDKMNNELGRVWTAIADVRLKANRSLRSFQDEAPVSGSEGQVLVIGGDGFEAGPTADEVSAAQGYAEAAAASAATAALLADALETAAYGESLPIAIVAAPQTIPLPTDAVIDSVYIEGLALQRGDAWSQSGNILTINFPRAIGLTGWYRYRIQAGEWAGQSSTFNGRAAAVAAAITPGWPVGSIIADGKVQYRYTGAGATIADMPGWVPHGDVYPDHWAENAVPGTTDMWAAITAAMAYTASNIFLRADAIYYSSAQIRFTGVNKSLQSAGGENAAIRFADTFDGPMILFEPPNPLDNVFRGGNSLKSITIDGQASTRDGRWAIDWRKQEWGALDDIRVVGCSFGIRFAGGQLNTLTDFKGDGAGLASALPGSTHVMTCPAENASGTQPNYTTKIYNMNPSAGFNNNIENLLTLVQADGLQIIGGYWGFAGNAMIKLAQGSGNAVTAVSISDVYFDGVSAVSGAQHFLSAADNAVVGAVNMAFSNCFIGNYANDIFDLNVNNNLRRLIFSGCIITTSTTGIGTIKGQSIEDGLRLQISKSAIRNAPAGLLISGASLVDLDAEFSDIDDATGALKLTGTVRQKNIAATFTTCVAKLSDTSTGLAADPIYSWETRMPVVSGPGVQSGASDAGIGKLLKVGAFGGNGATDAVFLTDFEAALVAGLYRGSSSSAGYNGPDVAGWSFACDVWRGESGFTWFFYRRGSGASPRAWFGFRGASTGAVTWLELLTTGSYRTSIAAAPERIGLRAIVGGNEYVATGTSSAADWKQTT